jgi:hypothetical protein
MGSVRDAGQWPETIARETAKYRGMNALFNGAHARFRLSHPTYSATADSHDERPPADPLILRLTISVFGCPRAATVLDNRFVGQGR